MSHIAGRARLDAPPYPGMINHCDMVKRLANLDQLPAPFGFTVIAFPFKLEHASAGWARVVAVVEEKGHQPT